MLTVVPEPVRVPRRTEPGGPHAVFVAVFAGQTVCTVPLTLPRRETPVIESAAEATAGTAAITAMTTRRLQTSRPIGRE